MGTDGPRGIDVSNHQQSINWPSVAAAGVKFAFIKATEGRTYRDPWYAQNVAGARAAGILVGAYHFARLNSGEVDHFLSADPSPLSLDLPPVLDLEVPLSPAGNEWADRFLDRLAVGWAGPSRPILYTGLSYPPGISHSRLSRWPLWLASYTAGQAIDPDPTVIPSPSTPRPWAVWQYTGTGRVPGITGNADENVADPAWLAQFTTEEHDMFTDKDRAVLVKAANDAAAARKAAEATQQRVERVLADIKILGAWTLGIWKALDVNGPHGGFVVRTLRNVLTIREAVVPVDADDLSLELTDDAEVGERAAAAQIVDTP